MRSNVLQGRRKLVHCGFKNTEVLMAQQAEARLEVVMQWKRVRQQLAGIKEEAETKVLIRICIMLGDWIRQYGALDR